MAIDRIERSFHYIANWTESIVTMARTTGSHGERTEAAIRAAATQLIALRGYEAVSMREIAAEVGVQAAALYRYFPNKQDLLFSLMRTHLEALLAAWEEERPSDDDPSARLAEFIRFHIRYHVERRHEVHIANMELRSLSKDHLTTILRLRSAYEKELRQILRDGVETDAFAPDDTSLVAMALIAMITGVNVWFRPDERLTADEVAENYVRMGLRLVGAAAFSGGPHVSVGHEIRAR